MIEAYELTHYYDEITTGLAMLHFAMAFRKEIRYEVRRRQGGVCDSCGQQAPLQTHHIKPESKNGSSTKIENAVGLCQDCHKEIDQETFKGREYNQVHTKDKYYPQGNGIK